MSVSCGYRGVFVYLLVSEFWWFMDPRNVSVLHLCIAQPVFHMASYECVPGGCFRWHLMDACLVDYPPFLGADQKLS